VGQVRHVDIQFDDVLELATGRFAHSFQVLEHLTGLGGKVARHHFHGFRVPRNMARQIHGGSGFDSLGGGTNRLRGVFGLDNRFVGHDLQFPLFQDANRHLWAWPLSTTRRSQCRARPIWVTARMFRTRRITRARCLRPFTCTTRLTMPKRAFWSSTLMRSMLPSAMATAFATSAITPRWRSSSTRSSTENSSVMSLAHFRWVSRAR